MGTKTSKNKKNQIIMLPQFWGNDTYENSTKYGKYSWDTYS